MANAKVKELWAYSIGPLVASVCTSLSDKELIEKMNEENPTGISAKWQIAKDKKFATGQTNPCPCPDHPKTHRHILLEC